MHKSIEYDDATINLNYNEGINDLNKINIQYLQQNKIIFTNAYFKSVFTDCN